MSKSFILGDTAREALDGGTYYASALAWYAHKYLACITEKIVFLYYTAIVCVAFFISATSLHGLFPLAKEFPIISYNDDVGSLTSVVTVGINRDDPPSLSLARYLVTQYVTKRESYDFHTIDETKAYILNMSTSSARLRYESEYLDMSDPSSMVLRYQRDGYRNAVVKKVTMLSNRSGDPYKALVSVEVTDSLHNDYADPIIFNIELQFDMPNLHLVYMGYVPFFFRVSKYSATT